MAKENKQPVRVGNDNGPSQPIQSTALFAALQVAIVEDANFRYTCFAPAGTPAYVLDKGGWQVLREDLVVPFQGRIMFPQNADGEVTNGFAFNIRVDAGVDAVISYLSALTYTFADA